MDEYVPITRELRDVLADMTWAEITDHITTVGLAYNLDSKLVLDDGWLKSWHQAARQKCDAIDATVRNLEQENAALKERDGWVALPVDADGKTIRGGDDVEWLNGTKNGLVTGIGVGERDGWVWVLMDGRNVSIAMTASDLHHRQPDTRERIIEDALRAQWSSRGERSADFDALVARCKALCERTKEW